MADKRLPTPSQRQSDDAAALGVFILYWSTFEVIIEIALMRELRLSEQETSIVCGGLMFQPKVCILYSLLNRDPGNKEKIDLLKGTVALAERNDFVHGFVTHFRDPTKWTLLRRTVREKYKVRAEELDMIPHVKTFMDAVDKVMKRFTITDQQVDQYLRSIEASA